MDHAILERLISTAQTAQRLLILPHSDPDPDAIGSAVALQYLLKLKAGLPGEIIYHGVIGRAENKALVRLLDHPLAKLSPAHFKEPVSVALIDTQPNTGNNALPRSIQPTIVIDHHPLQEEELEVPFADIRPDYGATSTILAEYLQTAEIEPSPSLATALFYGIETDTMSLGRGAKPPDVAAYFYLQQRIDVEMLVQIEQAQVPADYFRSLVRALQSTYLYGKVLASYIGPMSYPDLAAELGDLLLRLQEVRWVICIGLYQDSLILAIRTRTQHRGAGKLARQIVAERGSAGGHGALAGGQIPLKGEDPQRLAHEVIQRALQILEIDANIEGTRLLDPDHLARC
jgi:nanoRNase/pAp phosphatase (c-di-AMP/oligoRNAs hydrolase)